MSKPIDHIAYLSQEIGPRPAGTEEEQQAALYITERFQKETRLPVNIEDFTCSSNADMPKLICYIVTIVAVLLGLFLPVAAIPAVVASVLSAAVFVAESFDKPVLSQLFMKGVSQNVVAKYEPAHDPDGAGARRRKVILVANYDSGKVRHDLAGFLPSIRRPMQYAALASMCLLPIVLLIRQFAFAGEGVGATACLVIAVVLLVAVGVPAAFIALEKASAYNEGANSNASGIAVMLEVARRIGNGEAEGEPLAEGVMHDEKTARAAGVVPDGASLSYEHGGAEGPSRDEYLSDDPSEEDLSRARKETRSALTSAPIETLAAAAAKAAELHEAAEAAEAARCEQEEAERLAAEAEAAERARIEEEMRLAAEAAKAKPAPTVPEWYLKATEKARKSEPLLGKSESSYRSRYADFPDERRIVEEETMPEEEPIEIQEIPGSVEQVPYEDDLTAVEAEAVSETVEEEAPAADQEVQSETQGEAQAASETPEASAQADVEPVQTEGAEPAAPQAETAPEAQADQSAAAPAPAEAFEAGATTAMPAVSDAGSLDLDALRAAATEASCAPVEAVEADVSAPAAEPVPAAESVAAEPVDAEPAQQVEQAQPVEVASLPADATVPVSPQMMYYKEPEDRSQEMMDRARKERSVVTLTDEEVKDMTVAVEEAAPVASSAEVTSIPVEGVVSEPVQPVSEPAVDAASTAVLPVQPAAVQPAPVVPAPKQADRIIEARVPVVDLPSITLPAMAADPKPVSFDELRQRAPLASAAESKGEEAAKDLLAISLPSIEGPSGATGSFARVDAAQSQNTSVSLTGSFAPVGAAGVAPVGDELIENVDPEEVYVDDADDSVFEEEFTETGAFAGPGYVEMPQSRVGRFFGKFRRKKKKEEEQSAHEWLDVDEDFDARTAGKARGSWESFRNEEDDWQGGAFDGIKARMPRREDEEGEGEFREGHSRLSAPAVSHDAFAAALAAANAAAEAKGEKPVSEDDPYEEDVQQIYSFAAGDINTEVWFVALGSELAGNGGIKAFLAEHASDMRGAVIVNLESLGAGTLSYLEKEGELRQASCSPRMKRFIRKASQASGISILANRIDWRESAASYAQKHRMQAMTLVGMDGNKPARYGEADDIIENIDPDALDRSADMVIELLKNI